jgi:energy-coupling factor transporter ATP-binding protein EcfA2
MNEPALAAPEVTDAVVPFPSISSLRAAHGRLLKRHAEIGECRELLDEAEVFIGRGRATGAFLDAEDDRWAGQGLLDYWVAVLYRAGYEPPDATLAEFDPTLAPELKDEACPYVGLDAFSEANHRVFFGRRQVVEGLVGWLTEERLLTVVGPSGSGKSSLVLAGILPALKEGGVPGSGDWRYFPAMVPGSNPLANLARLVAPEADAGWIQSQAARFQEDAGALAHLIGQGDERPAVVIIDQFEEIFTLCDAAQVRKAFTDNLLGLIQASPVQHVVILTMRTDYESYVATLPEFHEPFERALKRVPPLSAAELREAIVRPAESVGLKFEEGVVDALLGDILGEPTALPLLQFTLLKLWEKRERNRVTWEAYQRLGGGRQALANVADEFYEGLIPEEQATVRYILLRMVRPGEGLEVTSSRIRRQTLYKAGPAPDRVDRVLGRLLEARLVRLTKGDTPDDDQVEVAVTSLLAALNPEQRRDVDRRGPIVPAALEAEYT